MIDNEFILAILKPVTIATVLAAILCGVSVSLIYWRTVRVSFYNGIMFNLPFYVMLYLVRGYVDGIDSSLGYIGLFGLYLLFMTSALMTKKVYTRFFGEYKDIRID